MCLESLSLLIRCFQEEKSNCTFLHLQFYLLIVFCLILTLSPDVLCIYWRSFQPKSSPHKTRCYWILVQFLCIWQTSMFFPHFPLQPLDSCPSTDSIYDHVSAKSRWITWRPRPGPASFMFCVSSLLDFCSRFLVDMIFRCCWSAAVFFLGLSYLLLSSICPVSSKFLRTHCTLS